MDGSLEWPAIVGVILTIMATVAGLFRYVGAQVEDAKRQAQSGHDKLRTEMSAVRAELCSEIDKVEKIDEKARHSHASVAQNAISGMAREIDLLRNTTARREELATVESRLTAQVQKLADQIDGIRKELSMLPVLGEQLKTLNAMVVRIETKMERTHVAGD